MSRRFLALVAIGLGALAATAVIAGAAVCLTSGCSTALYYAQSTRGHLALLESARPVADWLADPATSLTLKERLALTQRIRDFAVSDLALPDNASYRRYADLKRSAAVWNVVAAPALSLEAKTWCFAIVGCVAYRGYYDPADADALAATLRAEGLDVAVYPVPAYSTLGRLPQRGWNGWFSDPLLNTFVGDAEGDLARLVFHELAHQVAFAPGDTPFNESFATAVETLGERRWLAKHAGDEARAQASQSESRRADFRALVLRYRAELDALYRSGASDDSKRESKVAVLARLRADHVALKATRWQGYAGYDGWIARANNASFATLANYTALVPSFERLFELENGDFTRFYAAVKRLAALPSAERRSALAADADRAAASK